MSWLDKNVWDWMKEHALIWVVLILGLIVWIWFRIVIPEPTSVQEQGIPFTKTERHDDTTITQAVTTSQAEGTIKGERLPNRKTKYHKVFKTEHGEVTLDATTNNEDTTLAATIGVVDILDVPIITHTIKESTFQPITKTIEVPNASGWTWAGIGAGFGVVLSIIALFVLHVL